MGKEKGQGMEKVSKKGRKRRRGSWTDARTHGHSGDFLQKAIHISCGKIAK